LATRAEPFIFADTPFDAAIHCGGPIWPGAHAEFLFGEELVPVCSPALVKGRTQVDPAELAQLPLLHQSARPDAWREWFAVAGLENVNAMGGARYELFSMLVEAARAGLGVALVPRFFVIGEMASGQLLTPCPCVLHNQRSYYFVYPESKADSVPLAAFREWMRGGAQHRIVAMDDLRLVDIAEDVFDVLAGVAGNAPRIAAAVVDQAARDFPPSGEMQATAAPRSNSPCTSTTPIGSRLLPSASALTAPHRAAAAAQLQVIGQPLLARVERLRLGNQQGADRLALSQTRHHVLLAAAGDDVCVPLLPRAWPR
jgi:hypothetical protein